LWDSIDAANRKVLDYVKLSLDDVTEKKYIPKNKRVLIACNGCPCMACCVKLQIIYSQIITNLFQTLVNCSRKVHTALNHVDENMRVTDIYIAKSWDSIDAANRKVLDYITAYKFCLGKTRLFLGIYFFSVTSSKDSLT